MGNEVNTFIGVQSVTYSGDVVPRSEIRLGTVFFADDVGFGVVYRHSNKGQCVYGTAANGRVYFVLDEKHEFYHCKLKLSFDAYQNSVGAGKSVSIDPPTARYYGPTVKSIVLLGELQLKIHLDEEGNVVEGMADYEYAESMLHSYIDKYAREYRHCARLRRALEQGYDKLKLTEGLTEPERTFDPSKSEFLCLMRDATGIKATWYYRQRTGRFFACACDVDVLEDIMDAIPIQRSIVVKALTDNQAEEALRNAVKQGRLSTYVYAKYFGEYADMKTQIAVRIPTALKKRMDWTGLTIESILEKGCDAYLKEVQDEFTSQNINTNEEV